MALYEIADCSLNTSYKQIRPSGGPSIQSLYFRKSSNSNIKIVHYKSLKKKVQNVVKVSLFQLNVQQQ